MPLRWFEFNLWIAQPQLPFGQEGKEKRKPWEKSFSKRKTYSIKDFISHLAESDMQNISYYNSEIKYSLVNTKIKMGYVHISNT